MGSAVFLSGCLALTVGDVVQLVIGSTEYPAPATVEFGLADPDAGPVTLTGSLQNITTEEIVVLDVSVDGSAYSVDVPPLPFSVAASESVDVSLVFDPDDSGIATGTVSVTVERADGPFLINLTGEGNEPPVAYGAVTVQGGGLLDIRGTYRRTGEVVAGPAYDQGLDTDVTYDFPVYELPGSPYVIRAYNDTETFWVLDNDSDDGNGGTLLYSESFYAPAHALVAPSGDETTWVPQGAFAGPTVTGEIDSNAGEYAGLGETISVNYLYEDAEGDLEGETTFQWYEAGTIAGPYTAIAGATEPTLDLDGIDYYLKYLTCDVTPVATGGITGGETTRLGPIFVYGD